MIFSLSGSFAGFSGHPSAQQHVPAPRGESWGIPWQDATHNPSWVYCRVSTLQRGCTKEASKTNTLNWLLSTGRKGSSTPTSSWLLLQPHGIPVHHLVIESVSFQLRSLITAVCPCHTPFFPITHEMNKNPRRLNCLPGGSNPQFFSRDTWSRTVRCWFSSQLLHICFQTVPVHAVGPGLYLKLHTVICIYISLYM